MFIKSLWSSQAHISQPKRPGDCKTWFQLPPERHSCPLRGCYKSFPSACGVESTSTRSYSRWLNVLQVFTVGVSHCGSFASSLVGRELLRWAAKEPRTGNEDHTCVCMQKSTLKAVLAAGSFSHSHMQIKYAVIRTNIKYTVFTEPHRLGSVATVSLVFTLSYPSNLWSVTNGIHPLYVSWERLSFILEGEGALPERDETFSQSEAQAVRSVA